MFRYIIASLLIISFSGQMLGGFMIEIDYYLRTASYAKECVNKARPMMHCNGKCQMAKQMLQENKNDQNFPQRKSVNNKISTLSSKTYFASISLPAFFIIPTSKRQYLSRDAVSRSLDILHPPQA
ncbi:MAG: hypothetical protein ABI266_00150 [Ginsengibacter sp.]